jgi:hypothetical protein
MISFILFQAAHDSNCFLAKASADLLVLANQMFSISLPAKKIILFSRSLALSGCCCKILKTSLTCNVAPTQLPMTS